MDVGHNGDAPMCGSCSFAACAEEMNAKDAVLPGGHAGVGEGSEVRKGLREMREVLVMKVIMVICRMMLRMLRTRKLHPNEAERQSTCLHTDAEGNVCGDVRWPHQVSHYH